MKITKRSFINMSPSDIGRLKDPELRELLRGARQLYTQQEKVFKKYESKVWSPAWDKMRRYYDEHGKEKVVISHGVEYYSTVPQSINKMNLNQMRQEVYQLQGFFQSKTATVPGSRTNMKEMGARIFGTDKRGRPLHKLDVEQWTALWSLYEEYKRSKPTTASSTVLQQAVGQVIIDAIEKNSDIWLSSGKIEEIADIIKEEKKRMNWEMNNYEEGEPVLSGVRSY